MGKIPHSLKASHPSQKARPMAEHPYWTLKRTDTTLDLSQKAEKRCGVFTIVTRLNYWKYLEEMSSSFSFGTSGTSKLLALVCKCRLLSIKVFWHALQQCKDLCWLEMIRLLNWGMLEILNSDFKAGASWVSLVWEFLGPRKVFMMVWSTCCGDRFAFIIWLTL